MPALANLLGRLNLRGRLSTSQPSPADLAQEIDEELMFHFRLLIEENIAQGTSPDDAWSTAQKRFGSLQQYARDTRRIDMGHRLIIQRMAIFGVLTLSMLCGWLWLQVENLHGQNTQIMQLVQNTKAQETPAQDSESYPIKMHLNEMREMTKFSVDFAELQLRGEDVTVIPVNCELGTTGLMLIGNGTFHYAPDPEKKFDGQFHAALLRFNPKDLDSFVKLDQGKKVTDKGAYEMARGLMPRAVNHSWQSNGDALIPPEKTFSVVLYSPEYGDLLISAGPGESVVYDFTDRKSLYEKK